MIDLCLLKHNKNVEVEAGNSAPVFLMTLEQWREIYSMLGIARETLKNDFPEAFLHSDTQPHLENTDFEDMQNVVHPLKQKLDALFDD